MDRSAGKQAAEREFFRSRARSALVRQVRAGCHVADRVFDTLFPDDLRERSARYWTPLRVARRAAELLVTGPSTRVLDVGSGAGKFCLVGALTSRGYFTGLEHRAHLTRVASALAEEHSVERARFLTGDLASAPWGSFDAFYFFNPFAENEFQPRERFDHTVELTAERRAKDLRLVFDALDRAPSGTRVVTYYGLGGPLPSSYERRACERAGSDLLDLWVKR